MMKRMSGTYELKTNAQAYAIHRYGSAEIEPLKEALICARLQESPVSANVYTHVRRYVAGMPMKRFYLAGPLFCNSERTYNLKLREAFAEEGLELVLPQECQAEIDPARMADAEYASSKAAEVFREDIKLLESCDGLVLNLDGRVPDEGACVELGYALARGKPCFGIKTDVRTAEYGTDNMMISGPLAGRTARSVGELLALIEKEGPEAPR